jgi:hypothetical protein
MNEISVTHISIDLRVVFAVLATVIVIGLAVWRMLKRRG